METLLNILIVALGVAFVIFIHELGHFSVAKWLKMRVEAFSIGFGKVLWSFTRGETEYRLSLIPLGGYVKLGGESSEEATGENDFFNRPASHRALVLVAGVVMNVISGVAMLFAAFLIGILVVEPEITVADPTSTAFEAGLRTGDRITHVGGERVYSFADLSHKVALNGDTPLALAWLRGQETMSATLTPVYNTYRGLYTIAVADRPLCLVGALPKEEHYSSRQADFKEGDTIEAWALPDGAWHEIAYFDEFEQVLREAQGQTLSLRLRRKDGSLHEVTYTPRPEYRFGTVHAGSGPPNLIMRLFGAQTPPATLQVSDIFPGSPAATLGLSSGDTIESIAVEGESAQTLKNLPDLQKFIQSHPGKSFRIWWSPPDDLEQKTGVFKPREVWPVDFAPHPNFSLAQVSWSEPGLLVQRSFEKAYSDFLVVLRSLRSFVAGEVDPKNLSGPISIARASMRIVEQGLGNFLAFLALISFNLAILNILPIPLLDGGHLLMVGIEKLIGRQVNENVQIALQYVGILLLGSLFLFTFFNDIFRPIF